MKYYFISYAHRHRGTNSVSFLNFLSNEHPFEWQIKVRDNKDGDYSLICWQEITEEEFVRYKHNW